MKSSAAPLAALALWSLLASSGADGRTDSPVIEQPGMCDASAAVAAGANAFLVANDEDNVLRVYRGDRAGPPLHAFDLTTFLKPDPDQPETDIEGATRLGNHIFWITSHGSNRNGKPRPSRHRLFATRLELAGARIDLIPIGIPYQHLLEDLAATPALKAFRWKDAAEMAPEAVGGLNIEGLAATPRGTLLIAFRNPLPGGHALIIPLENPEEVIGGGQARFGAPFLLSLQGNGIRSIEYSQDLGEYLIVAGPRDDAGDFALYRWAGSETSDPEPVPSVHFGDLKPEALIVRPGEPAKFQLLSDDGDRKTAGVVCKEAPAGQRRFRAFWVRL